MALAQDLRVALWHAPVTRNGPGLLLRDLANRDEQLVTFANEIQSADADIVVLTRFDFDASGQTLAAFADLIDGGYAFAIPLRSNAGVPTLADMDSDGRFGEPEDSQAFGRFPGEEALAILSRYPTFHTEVRSFNDLLWRDVPDGLMAESDTGRDTQRLSSGGHWIVPVEIGAQGHAHRLSLLVGHAGPPVFDGPEDRNGRRNRDELRLWEQIIGQVDRPYLFTANTNLDPDRGDGYRDAMAEFLSAQHVNDPLAGQTTAHWDTPGPMRVSYVLPSPDLGVVDAKVLPVLQGQHHSLITVDLTLP